MKKQDYSGRTHMQMIQVISHVSGGTWFIKGMMNAEETGDINAVRRKMAELRREKARIDDIKQYIQESYDSPGVCGTDDCIVADAAYCKQQTLRAAIEIAEEIANRVEDQWLDKIYENERTATEEEE